MPENSAKTYSSWVEIDISAQALVRDLTQQFVEEAKSTPGIINASILSFDAAPRIDLAGGMTERIRLEIEPSAAAALLAQIMRLVILKRDATDSEITVILRKTYQQSVEINGSLPDDEYLSRANKILSLITVNLS